MGALLQSCMSVSLDLDVPSNGFMCLLSSPGFGLPWVPLSTTHWG